MAPVFSWLLRLSLRPDVPVLGWYHLGRFHPSPVGHLVREAWLHLPVLHGAGLDLWQFEPARFSGIVHIAGGVARCRVLLGTIESELLAGWGAVQPGAPPRRLWRPEPPWTPIRTPDQLADWRRRLRAASLQAAVRRSA